MDRWTNDPRVAKESSSRFGLAVAAAGAGVVGLVLLTFVLFSSSRDAPVSNISLSEALETALAQVVTFRSPALQPDGRAAMLVQKREAAMALRDRLGPLAAQEPALFALLNGRLDTAQKSVRIASAYDVDIAASVARLRMDYTLAAQLLRRALEQGPDNALQLRLSLADILAEQGRVTGDVEPMREAVALYQDTIIPGIEYPEELALVTNNLGIALQGLAVQTRNTAMLEEAAMAFAESLRIAPDGGGSASTKANLASVLYDLAVIEPSETLLAAAETALRDAVQIGTTPMMSLYQRQLVSVLLLQAQNPAQTPPFDEIDQLLQAVVYASPPILTVNQAASLYTKFGNVLAQHGEIAADSGLLVRAAQAYDAALSRVDQTAQPLVWAGLQANLGTVNAGLAGRNVAGYGYEQAAAAFRAALGTYSAQGASLHWAMIQSNFALTLEGEAARLGDVNLLNESLRRYSAALDLLEDIDPAMARQVRQNLTLAELRTVEMQLQMSSSN
ncbi:hypothetical protein [Abyssibius alkaniclasticus]|uniref:hypothetical protein n=1 Tax=Abyssibius alkaniclasticus TaxID=2881234 RepID=UPI00405911DA